jgi:protein-S-isoprenylcysteine O-methyltransferase Ste14
MKKRKSILVTAVIGAVVGAIAVRYGARLVAAMPASAREFLVVDHTLRRSWQYLAACVGWVVFSLYWEYEAKNSAAAKSAESKGSRGLHVFLANLGALMELMPIRGLGRFAPNWPPMMALGVAIVAAGVYLAIWARRCLGRNWSGEISIKVEHELIRSGPYRWLRHPIYTGLLMMYVGTALVTGLWLGALGLAMAGFAYWRKIRLEEKNLEAAFGAEYEAYRRETWALMPGVY